MKIAIDHQGVKRNIEGPFNVCGTKADLLAVADQLYAAARDNFSYGWIEVRTTTERMTVNTPPIGWRDNVTD